SEGKAVVLCLGAIGRRTGAGEFLFQRKGRCFCLGPSPRGARLLKMASWDASQTQAGTSANWAGLIVLLESHNLPSRPGLVMPTRAGLIVPKSPTICHQGPGLVILFQRERPLFYVWGP
uniref:Uncharacterized protein n=1 Tax=Geospiza parvula TaxID=87175 RepID=A0A8U8B2P3_GEOPR